VTTGSKTHLHLFCLARLALAPCVPPKAKAPQSDPRRRDREHHPDFVTPIWKAPASTHAVEIMIVQDNSLNAFVAVASASSSTPA